MELPIKVESVLKTDSDNFICCTGKDYLTTFKPLNQKQSLKVFEYILDNLGALSAKAQALKQIITNSMKFIGTDHRIYIKAKDNKVLGFIRVGQKNLFYRDFIGNVKELKPTCILDFYVHQSCQRSGIGKEIFEKFLKMEGKAPEKLAYDRPSQKLIGFLKKHYGLVKYIPQNNNYVIFDRYFTTSMSKQHVILPSNDALTQVKSTQIQQQVSNNGRHSQLNDKIRPKSYLPNQKIQQIQQPPTLQQSPTHQKLQQKRSQIKRQFQQFQQQSQTAYFNKTKHKNNTSQGFPLSNTTNTEVPMPIVVGKSSNNNNNTFRTTSNAYGNYYKNNNNGSFGGMNGTSRRI